MKRRNFLKGIMGGAAALAVPKIGETSVERERIIAKLSSDKTPLKSISTATISDNKELWPLPDIVWKMEDL